MEKLGEGAGEQSLLLLQARRQQVAEFLAGCQPTGHEPANVRIKFDEERWAEAILEVAAAHPEEELTHSTKELALSATQAIEDADTLAQLEAYHRRQDEAA